METISKTFSMRAIWLVGIGVVIIAIGMAWQFSSVNHIAAGSSERAFLLDTNYDKFRQILVRTDVTRDIISASGLALKDERIVDLVVDATADRRPVINALLGKSKTELEAKKHLTVSVKNSEVNLDTLELTQYADLGNERIDVRTVADQPTGKLESYETSFKANRVAEGTEVILAVRMKVNTTVPRLFKNIANQRVQAAADKSTQEQEAALRDVVAKHASELTIHLIK